CHTVAAAEADCRQSRLHHCRYNLLVHHSRKHHERHVASFGVGYSQAIDEVALLAEKFERASERRTSAMHHGYAMPVLRHLNHRARTFVQRSFVFERDASNFYDDLHRKPAFITTVLLLPASHTSGSCFAPPG